MAGQATAWPALRNRCATFQRRLQERLAAIRSENNVAQRDGRTVTANSHIATHIPHYLKANRTKAVALGIPQITPEIHKVLRIRWVSFRWAQVGQKF
jgi:hypothetical protein